jgi:hypothetical protein
MGFGVRLRGIAAIAGIGAVELWMPIAPKVSTSKGYRMSPERMMLALQLSKILAALLAVVVISGTIITTLEVRKAQPSSAKMLNVFFEQGTLLQIVTVIAVISSALLLRILDQISSEATVSILSGTAGYVLGALPKGKRSSEP